jgi:hypothetical protein
MAGYGIPESEIAKVLEIEPDKLRELYGKVIDGARTKANARVAESLFRKATGEGRESVTAAIFCLKTRAGWKETSTHELTGTDEGPIKGHHRCRYCQGSLNSRRESETICRVHAESRRRWKCTAGSWS